MDPFVVVGGDAAGLSAASKCKRESPDRDVIVFEKGRWVSYAHCGMPYYIKGEVPDLLSMTTLSPADIDARGIDLRREHEVTRIDETTVTATTPDGTVEQRYGDLLIATGARAIAPIDGTDIDGVFTLHHMDSAAALRAFLEPTGSVDPAAIGNGYTDDAYVGRYGDRQPPDTVVIVGGGYVGVETAEAMAAHDVTVHLFQRGDRLVPPFGEAVAQQVATELREQNVRLHLDTAVDRLRADADGRLAAVVHGDAETPADAAVVGVGIRPNVTLAEQAGIELGASGAIATDEYGETSEPGVYAAGDCAEMTHVVTGDADWVPLGLTANRAGRAVGATVGGDPTPTGQIAGTAALKAFELQCGRTGITAHDRAERAGFDPVSAEITATSRSGYYPGAADTTVTLCADRDTGRLLGGTIVGTDRAAVRINVVATALEGNLTVSELERTDLAYAPPVSPVWDPILVASKVLAGKLPD